MSGDLTKDVVSTTGVLKAADGLSAAHHALIASMHEGAKSMEQAVAAAQMAYAKAAPYRQRLNEMNRPASRREIGAALTVLLAGYPNTAKSELEAFGALLLKHVSEQEPSVGALDAGVSKLQRTSKFLPSIAETLEAIAAARSSIRRSLAKLDETPKLLTEVRELQAKGRRQDLKVV